MSLNVVNFFETRLSVPMEATDLEATLVDVTGLVLPMYLVIDPAFPDLREVILFDGTITDNVVSTTVIGNRFLEGSTSTTTIQHAAGARVISTPLKQHLDEIETRLAALETP